MEQIDFLAIGDIVTEPFIRLKDAESYCDIDEENCKLCMRFGDKIPYESREVCRAVGNSPNAAVSASYLGLKSAVMTYIGDDDIGRGNVEELKMKGVNTDYVVTVPNMESNYHYVLWFGVERTILVNHAEYPYSFPMDMTPPKWMYLSSLAANSAKYHDEISSYLLAHPEVKLAFQPGTFQMKLGKDALKDIYARTEIFFCNVEEAKRILGTDEKDHKKLIDMIHSLGPKMVVVTDGIKGAYAYNGENYFFMPVYPHEPFERTGAGDAFASTFTSAIALGKTFEEALMWAPINSMSVVSKVGAQNGLLKRDELEKYLSGAPVGYKPNKI